MPGLSLVALVDFANARDVPLSETALLTAYVGLPWTFSFLWGPVIDNLRWPRLPRRAGWIFVMAAMGLVPLLMSAGVADVTASIGSVATLFAVHSLFASVIDASTDALIIEMTPAAEVTRLHAWGRGGLLSGTAISTLVFAALLPRMPFAVVAITLAALWAAAFIAAAVLYRSDWESVGMPTEIATETHQPNYVATLLQHLFSRRSLVTAASFAAAYAVYTVLRLVTNYNVVQSVPEAAERFTQVRGLANLAVSVAMIFVAQLYLTKISIRRQSVWSAAILVGFVVVAGGLLWTSSTSIAAIVVYAVALGLAKLMLYLTACRHFATLAVPLTAGAQFTAYMAMLNIAEVVSAGALSWAGVG